MKKRLLSLFAVFCLIAAMVPAPVQADGGAASGAEAAEPPAIPTSGDKWNGSAAIAPSKTVRGNDGREYYEITKCAELAYVAREGGVWLERNYILANDLILNDVEIQWDGRSGTLLTSASSLHKWTPIAKSDERAFSGAFDGGGHTISGLYVEEKTFNAGLFGNVSAFTTIKNLTVVNGYVKGLQDVGGITGHGGFYDDCVFSGAVIGSLPYGDTSEVIASVGGIAGRGYLCLDCAFFGTIISKGAHIGGIMGNLLASTAPGVRTGAENCVAHGTISGETAVGGILGSGHVTNCANYSAVSGTTDVGGVVGRGSDSIASCVNRGAVNGKGENVGGITGRLLDRSSITDCYNTGKIEGRSNVGGIAGGWEEGSPIKWCYNIGEISSAGGGSIGAITGSGDGSITGCYYLQSAGLHGCGGVSSDPEGVSAKSAEQLKQQDTFDGWAFDTTWRISQTGNDGYPYLVMEDKLPGAPGGGDDSGGDGPGDGGDGGDVTETVHETDGSNLKAVIQSAKSGDTVKLISDYETSVEYIPVIDKGKLTIDLGGNTLTFKTPAPNQTSGKIESRGLWVYGTDVTVKNGTIQSVCTGNDGDLAATLYISAIIEGDKPTGKVGSVTLDNVKVTGAAGVEKSGYAAALYGGTLTVGKGSSLTSSENAAIYGYGEAANRVNIFGAVTHTGTFSAVEGSYASTGTMTINVHDGAVINGGQGAGILQMAPGSVTVDGGSITGASSGIAMTKGELRISGGEISGTGAYQEYQGSANYKVYDNGAAVYIEPVAAGTKVTVSGGTLKSANSYALSAPKEGNTGENLTLAITGGVFVGSSKGAVDAEGETGVVSGGAFSSPVDDDLLSDEVKYIAEKAGGDARYSYHKTPSEAWKAAGEDGKVSSTDGTEVPPVDPGDPEEPSGTYKITIADMTNGTVTADKTSAEKGDTITLTITPASGYSLDTISTTPKLDLVGSGNTRTFTMPESDVTVSATFAANSTSTRLTGTVIIDGWPWVGETLTARVRNTNNTGRLYYQWTADGYNLWGETSPDLYLTDYTYGKVIRCVVTSSVQTGSITGRLSETVGHYNGRYYPTESPANSSGTNQSGTNQSGTNQSGNAEGGNDFTFDTPLLTTATNADGTKTTTIIEPDGSSGLVMLTNYGTVSSASMTFSSSAFANALRTGSALVVPTSVQSSRSAGSAAPVRIVLPQTVGSVKVKIPVSKMTAGTVAVMENYFGPDTVVRSSVSESDGVVFRLTGSAVVKIVDNSRSFQDVSGGEWYAKAVNWAASREVMNGVSAKMFDPQGTVNRAMMTQMLYNFDGAEYTGATAQFSDVSSGNWYAASVSWATRNQIARNYGNRFGAEDALTREDMAAMLYNYARLKGYSTYASGSLSAFSDNGSVSDWARPAMQWAVGAGLITGTQNGTRTVVLDPQGTVTRAQLATIMQRFNNLY